MNINDKNKQRNISLDLLRILSMIGIIILHLLGQGGIIASQINVTNSLILKIIFYFLFVSVNIFPIITGYFYFNKKIYSFYSILNLFVIVIFYSILITLIFYNFNICNVKSYGQSYFIYSLFPMIIGRYWFFTCYIFLFMMIPFINSFIEKVGRQELNTLIKILFVLFCIITDFGGSDYFRILGGYSPFWLTYLYMIGAYIKKYNINVSTSNCLKYITVSLLLNSLIVILCYLFLNSNNPLYTLGTKYNSPFICIMSIFIFLLFKNIKIKNKIISTISSTSFSVYIIHSHRLLFENVINNYHLYLFSDKLTLIILEVIILAILIYCISSIIEYIRIFIFNILKVNVIILKISNRINKCMRYNYETNS